MVTQRSIKRCENSKRIKETEGKGVRCNAHLLAQAEPSPYHCHSSLNSKGIVCMVNWCSDKAICIVN